MLLALSEPVTTGLFALGGVVVGALVTGGLQVYFEWRRDRADLRQAKRLIAEDVLRIHIHYDGLIKSGSTPRTLGGDHAQFLPTDAWREHGPTLARSMNDDDDYEVLSHFMGTVPVARQLLAERPANSPLGADLLQEARNGRDLADACYRILTGKAIPA